MRLLVLLFFLLFANNVRAVDPVNLALLDPQFKVCDYNRFDQCFTAPSTDLATNRAFLSQSFVMAHPNKTEYVAVLAHGLTDSPYYFKDIARVLYEHGMNVIAVRLSGHGTVPEDLKTVHSDDWRNNIEFGIEQTRALGDKVILGGFSTGGALAIDRLITKKDASGLLLFSPAINIADAKSYMSLIPMACAWQPWAYPPYRPEFLPTRYCNMASNAVAQLTKVTISNWGSARNIHVPTFMAYTYRDKMISPESLQEFAKDLPNHESKTIVAFLQANAQNGPHGAPESFHYVTTEKSIGHSHVPLKTNPIIPSEFNPRFDVMETRLSRHLTRNFGLMSCRAALNAAGIAN